MIRNVQVMCHQCCAPEQQFCATLDFEAQYHRSDYVYECETWNSETSTYQLLTTLIKDLKKQKSIYKAANTKIPIQMCMNLWRLMTCICIIGGERVNYKVCRNSDLNLFF